MTFYNDSPEAERAMMLAMRQVYEHRTQLALFSLCMFCILKVIVSFISTEVDHF